MTRPLADIERDLAQATAKSARLCAARAALPAGASRAQVTTANARWARAAEERDRLERMMSRRRPAERRRRWP